MTEQTQHNFTVMVYDLEVPVMAYMDEKTGRAYHLESPKDDEKCLFDNLKSFKFMVRKRIGKEMSANMTQGFVRHV